MAKLGKLITLICLFLGFAASNVAVADPSISLSVEPTTGTLDDTFVLSITVEGSAETEYPILSGGDEFEVNLIGPETRIEVINGTVAQHVTYRYRLIPKKEGTFMSPTAKVTVNGDILVAGGIPIKITKSVSNDPTVSETKETFAKQTIVSETVYEGEQIPYTLIAYTRPQPLEFNVDNYSFDGFWTEEMGKIEKGVVQIKGETFTTVKVRRALFPLSAGDFVIPSRKVTLKVREPQRQGRSPFGGMFGYDPFDDPFFGQAFGNVGERVMRTNEVKLTVLPLPEVTRENGVVTMSSVLVGATSIDLTGGDGDIKFGDSKTLNITVRTEGNINPLTSLKLPATPNFRVYEETPTLNRYEVAGKLVSEKSFKISLVPEHGGEVSVPPIKIQFFNPESKKFEVAQTKPIKFKVEGGPPPKAPSSVSVKQEKSSEPNSETIPTKKEFEEDSFIKSLFRRISLSTLMLGLFTLVLLTLGILAGAKSSAKAKEKIQFKKKIQSAPDLSSLSHLLREIITIRIPGTNAAISNEELKAHIRKDCQNPDLAFALQSLLDELDLARFSGNSTDASTEVFKARMLELLP